MAQKYVLYFNRKALLFNNSQSINKQVDRISNNAQSIKNKVIEALDKIYNNENQGFKLDLNPLTFDEVLPILKDLYIFVQAAGGIVENNKGELLFIYRLGCWDLPKGKVEKNESIDIAAAREISEETGLNDLNEQRFLLKTYHTYKQKNKNYLKETTWYTFKTDSNEMLTPQAEEDITQAIWVNREKISEILNNTYPSIVDVVSKYLD